MLTEHLIWKGEMLSGTAPSRAIDGNTGEFRRLLLGCSVASILSAIDGEFHRSCLAVGAYRFSRFLFLFQFQSLSR